MADPGLWHDDVRRVGLTSGQPSFYNDLEEVLCEIWRLLDGGVNDRSSAFHTPTIATLREDGSPALRTVVLRAVDPDCRTIRFHTDRRATKAREIARHPVVEAHVYDPERKVQLRLRGRAEVHRTDATAAAAWQGTRAFSRACYRSEIEPGREIDDPTEVLARTDPGDPDLGRENFAAVTVKIDTLEWLYLAARGHRRARFHWRGEQVSAVWLAP